MMDFCVINTEGVIENIIVSDSDFAAEIGALPSYEGAAIGAAYEPPPEPEPEPEPSVWDELDAAYREGVNAV